MENYKTVYYYVQPTLTGEHELVVMTEQDILDCYWHYWAGQMDSVGKAHLISKEACIDDWVVVNWATKALMRS